MNTMVHHRGWPLLALLLLSAPLPGQAPPNLLADLNQQLTPNADSSPHGGIEFGAYTFFRARTDRLGWRIWRTEIATGRTDLVLQNQEVLGGEFSNPLVVGTRLVFPTLTATWGDELVVIDDATNPVPRIVDLRPGTDSSYPRSYTVHQGDLYFTAYDAAGNWGLWRANPTLTGASPLQVLQPAAGFPPTTTMISFGGRLYFTGSTTLFDHELWTTDGTQAGTFPVADINPGPTAGSSPGPFQVLGNHLYFPADDGTHGRELWRTDGTFAGTSLVIDLNPGPASGLFALYRAGNSLVFPGTEPATGTELWVSDGTAGGTVLRLDFHPGASPSTYAWFRPFGNRLVFSVGSVQQGSEPWITDGTSAGTHILADAWPGTLGSFPAVIGEATPSLFFFRTGTPAEGAELWRTDGSQAGTFLVRDIWPGTPSSNAIGWTAGGNAYLQADEGIYGNELWVSDGTIAGTQLVADLNPVPEHVNSSYPGNFTSIGLQLFFTADDGLQGNEPWVHDDAGTRLVADINPGPEGSAAREFTPFGDRILFRASEPATGYELWSTDGTPAGTYLVRDINPGSENSTPVGFTALDDRVVFSAGTRSEGYELWVSDGTTAGTQLLLDIRPGFQDSNPGQFVRVGDHVYFLANDGTTGAQLWRTDGTTSGTHRVSAIGGAIAVHRVFELGGQPMFLAIDAVNGLGLWRTDGTPGGTQLVTALATGARIEDATLAGSHLYIAITTANRPELWTTDGTAMGTRLVHPFGIAESWGVSNILAPFGDRVLVRVETHAEGLEPWVSDGTAAGTHILADILPGQASALDREQSIFHVVDGRLAFFAARSFAEGRELWLTDGTTAGTRLLTDLDPGRWDGVPRRATFGAAAAARGFMTTHLGQTYLGATDGTTGVEPFVFFSGLATTQIQGTGCAVAGSPPQLRATAPILGGAQSVTVSRIPAVSMGVTLIGLPTSTPIPVTPTCQGFIDPTLLLVLDRFSTQAGGTYVSSFAIPNDPVLSGVNLTYQAFLLSNGANPGLSATEAILATFGS